MLTRVRSLVAAAVAVACASMLTGCGHSSLATGPVPVTFPASPNVPTTNNSGAITHAQLCAFLGEVASAAATAHNRQDGLTALGSLMPSLMRVAAGTTGAVHQELEAIVTAARYAGQTGSLKPMASNPVAKAGAALNKSCPPLANAK